MFRVLPKALCILAAISTLHSSRAEGYCARCAKIEAERAEEQAEHPQPVQYYDDQKNFHNGNTSSPPENSPKVQAGNRAGASAASNRAKKASLVADASSTIPRQTPQQWTMEKDVDKFTPEMDSENKFIQESQNRYDRLNQENRQMIQGDQKMMREGYDPNEKYFQPEKPNINGQNNKSKP